MDIHVTGGNGEPPDFIKQLLAKAEGKTKVHLIYTKDDETLEFLNKKMHIEIRKEMGELDAIQERVKKFKYNMWDKVKDRLLELNLIKDRDVSLSIHEDTGSVCMELE